MTDATSPRILIVDDDDAIRTLLSRICSRLGFECDSAADGAEALDKLAAAAYDVMLLDLMMPKVNGYQVIAAIREMSPRPIVIVITAQAPRQTGDIATGDVVRTVITKPFDLDQLADLLRDCVTGLPHVSE